jgi:hypothetical protein
MSRKSLVGPLILILLGVLFLVNNLYPDLKIFTQLILYWPFLLIAWGLLRLIEILALAARGGPIPARGLSGGEIALVVLICLLGTATYTAKRRLPNVNISFGRLGVEAFGEAFEYPVELRQDAGPKPRIILDIPRGNARVTGDATGEIRVGGTKSIRALDRRDADRMNQEASLRLEREGNRLVVRAQPLAGEARNVTLNLEIQAPRDASIEARGGYGDFDISGLDGSVEIVSDNAGVRLSQIGGNVRVETKRSDVIRAAGVKGDVSVSGRGNDVELADIQGQASVQGSFSGDLVFRNLAKPLRFASRSTELSVEQVPGNLHIDLGDVEGTNLVGPIQFTSRSKDLRLSEFKGPLTVSLDRGDVDLDPRELPLSKMDVRVKSGDLKVTLPGAAKFELAAQTERGEVRNDFGEMLTLQTEGRSARLAGRTGAGPSINLLTSRGSVTVRKQ